jgi:soluble lytic murein transglycosylase-like protein
MARAPQLNPIKAQTPRAAPKLLSFVQRSNPNLGTKEAERIARLVEEVAEEFHLDVPLFAAIVRQESHFKTGIKSCRKVEGKRTCDYGMAQVNGYWVDELELDARRLRTDDGYNLRVAAGILRDVLDRHTEKLGYTYYHSADPELRVVYSAHIEKYRRQAGAVLVARN